MTATFETPEMFHSSLEAQCRRAHVYRWKRFLLTMINELRIRRVVTVSLFRNVHSMRTLVPNNFKNKTDSSFATTNNTISVFAAGSVNDMPSCDISKFASNTTIF